MKNLIPSKLKVNITVPVEVECSWDYDRDQAVISKVAIEAGYHPSVRDVYTAATKGALAALDNEVHSAAYKLAVGEFKRACREKDMDARVRCNPMPASQWQKLMWKALDLYPQLPVDIIAATAEREGLSLEPRLDGTACVVFVGNIDENGAVERVVKSLESHDMVYKFETFKEESRTRLVWG